VAGRPRPRRDGFSRRPREPSYRVPRNEGGYWVIPGITNAIPAATRAYSTLIEAISVKYSRYR